MDTEAPVPPFPIETAARRAEDSWNICDPGRMVLACTEDTQWRIRARFPAGREQARSILQHRRAKERDYRLITELWAFGGKRIAARLAYEWHDDCGPWSRSYGTRAESSRRAAPCDTVARASMTGPCAQPNASSSGPPVLVQRDIPA